MIKKVGFTVAQKHSIVMVPPTGTFENHRVWVCWSSFHQE